MLRLFLDDFRTTIKEEQVICKLSGEGGIKTWDTYRYLFGTVLLPLNERIKECGLTHEVELIDANTLLILDQFKPEVGMCYEINWDEIEHNGQRGVWSARIRVDDISPEKWKDLDTGTPLDKYLTNLEVKWFREIAC